MTDYSGALQLDEGQSWLSDVSPPVDDDPILIVGTDGSDATAYLFFTSPPPTFADGDQIVVTGDVRTNGGSEQQLFMQTAVRS